LPAPVEENWFFPMKFVGTNSEIVGTNYGTINGAEKISKS